MTVAERLAESKAASGVSESAYRRFLDGDVSLWSSWALWGSETADLSVFDAENRPWERLRSDVFLMGGNTGLFGDGAMKRCGNFHTAGHPGDGKLRNTVPGTPFEGSFLTDVVKDFPTSDSGPLLRAIRSGDVDVQKHVVEPLELELDTVCAPDDVVVVLLGKGTVRVWDAVVSRGVFPSSLLNRLTVLAELPHHTAPVSFKTVLQEFLDAPLTPHVSPATVR